MTRLHSILLTLVVPVALVAGGCSSDGPTSRHSSGATGNQDPNDAAMPEEQMPPEEENEGEEPTEDAGPSTPADTGSGGGTVKDTGSGGGTTEDTGGGTVTPPPPAPKTFNVTVENFDFSPKTMTVHVGDTVVWNWKDSIHSVTSGPGCTSDGKFDSGIRDAGATFSQTFTSAGAVDYHCIPHCAMGMVGKITVLP